MNLYVDDVIPSSEIPSACLLKRHVDLLLAPVNRLRKKS